MSLRRTSLAILLAALLAASLFSVSGASAATRDESPSRVSRSAQEAAEGDLVWAFAPRGIFADARVVMAFALLLDEPAVMSAAALSNTPLYYDDPEVRSVVDQVPATDATDLLAAAGIATHEGAPLIEESRRCQIWTPTTGDSLADRQAVVAALGDGLVAAFAQIGVTIEPCAPAASAAEADVAVSVLGLDSGLPAFGDIADETFIAILPGDAAPASGGTGAGASPGTTDIAPAQGGNAGLSVRREAADVQLAAAVVALGLLLFGGRWLSGARREP